MIEDTISEDICDYNVYFTFDNPDLANEKVPLIHEFCNSVFPSIELFDCQKCGQCFSTNDTKCSKYYHEGKRIPFETGEMEIVEYDGENPIIIHNYDCCGEIEADKPGCKSVPNGYHEKSTPESRSKISFSQSIEHY